MPLDDYKVYAPTVVRVGISLVFLWFGLVNIFNPNMLVGYIPPWFPSQIIAPLIFTVITGVFEVVIGLALLAGLYTRVAAFLAFLHILSIGISLGYNDIAVRDIGLAIVAFAIFLYGPDKLCLDNKIRKK